MSRRGCAPIDLSNQKFGKWEVLEYSGRSFWKCKCTGCGLIKTVESISLRRGVSKGCKNCKVTTGATRHGLSKDVLRPYSAWWDMLARCENKDNRYYKYYGDRGIKVCERWHDITLFYEDMGPRPAKGYTLDRINNNGNYEPGNCKWATMKEQSRNKRNNSYLTIDGITRVKIDWCELVGLKSRTLYGRLLAGWSVKDAVFTPPHGRKRPPKDHKLS